MWRGELDPDNGALLFPLRPGRVERTALLIRRMARDGDPGADQDVPTPGPEPDACQAHTR